MTWRYDLPKRPVSPEDRGEFMKPNLPDWKQDQAETSRLKPKPETKSPVEQMDVRFSPLEEFMERFSDHDVECATNMGTAKCSCGYDEARAALRQPIEQMDVWGALKKLRDTVDLRMNGFSDRAHSIFNGQLIALELAEVGNKLDVILAALPPSNPPGAESIARPKCALCGLEDGACICAHIPKPNSVGSNPNIHAAAQGSLLAANPPGDVREKVIEECAKKIDEIAATFMSRSNERMVSLDIADAIRALAPPKDAAATPVGGAMSAHDDQGAA